MNTVAVQSSIRYRGHVYDYETGLYYLQSRYYDAETGRFLNADAVDYIGYSGEQLSYNAFAYCENEPVNGWDPTGEIRYDLKKYTSSQWVFKVVKHFRRYYEQGTNYNFIDFVNYNIGVGVRIGTSVGASLKNSGSLSYSRGTLKANYMGISLFSGAKTGFATSFDIDNYTIRGQYANCKKYESVAFSIISNFKNRNDKAYLYYSINFTFFIYKITKYVIKAAAATVCVAVPQLYAVVKSVNSTLKAGSLVSSKTLVTALKSFYKIFYNQRRAILG